MLPYSVYSIQWSTIQCHTPLSDVLPYNVISLSVVLNVKLSDLVMLYSVEYNEVLYDGKLFLYL